MLSGSDAGGLEEARVFLKTRQTRHVDGQSSESRLNSKNEKRCVFEEISYKLLRVESGERDKDIPLAARPSTVQETGKIPDCSFHLPVIISQNHPVRLPSHIPVSRCLRGTHCLATSCFRARA